MKINLRYLILSLAKTADNTLGRINSPQLDGSNIIDLYEQYYLLQGAKIALLMLLNRRYNPADIVFSIPDIKSD